MTHNQNHTRAIDYALAHERWMGIDHSVMPARAETVGGLIKVTTKAFDGQQRVWNVQIDEAGYVTGSQV